MGSDNTNVEQSTPIETTDQAPSEEVANLAGNISTSSLQIQLVPPIDVSYFSRQHISVFRDRHINHGKDSAGSVTWDVDIFKYATGASPTDPKFEDRGEIVLLFLHSGSASLGDVAYERQFRVASVGPHAGEARAIKHEPGVGSGTKRDDYYDFTIDYKETLQMLRNNGNEPVTFEAVYRDTYTRYIAQQHGYVGANEIEFTVDYMSTPYHIPTTTFPIRGFSVFKCSNPKAFPLRFEFRFRTRVSKAPGKEEYSDEALNTVDVKLGF